VVFNPELNAKAHELAHSVRSEFVISVRGTVKARQPETVNKNLSTGEIELWADDLEVLNEAKTPPFTIEDDLQSVGEDLRLKYRYLDLRRPSLQRNFILRHRLALATRQTLDAHGFLELETPMLTRSTPEGARDYLVPSRIHRGSFYALPQSPQIFKQLFMVSGFDRYFQITRCFRDEDLRADRQPEFTQIDMELSFVDMEDIFTIVESLMATLCREIDVTIPTSFPRLSYQEVMNRFGSDKPDLRFDLELQDVSSLVRGSSFQVFERCLENEGVVKCIHVPEGLKFSRKDIESLEQWLKQDFGIKGLAWFKVENGVGSGGISKFLGQPLIETLVAETSKGAEGLWLFVADALDRANQSLGALRLHLGKTLQLINQDAFSFLWVVDFPLLEFDADADRFVALHHPFTAPLDEDLPLMRENPGAVRAKAYDLVLNGFEIGGGSIRIHRRDTQNAMFQALGISEEEQQEKFGFLLDALGYGAPPHGGIAFGLDRIAMIFAKEQSLRDVIAFPKTTSATCLMTQSPSRVSTDQLVELGLHLAVPPK
jgi:aspartyl-tRNA synthetase